MSSQAAKELGPNAVVCYFPSLPYYHRYQIGFDIFVDPSDAEADRSVEGQPQRLIHVQLEFPDGFVCRPAGFGRKPRSVFPRGRASHLFPPHPHFRPPMYPEDFPDAALQFLHDIPVEFQDPLMWPEQHKARMKVCVENGKPGDFVVIDETPCEAIRQCKQCYEFHREPYHIQARRSQDVPERSLPQQPRQQSGLPGQHPSTSGTAAQSDTSHAEPHAATKRAFREPKKRDLTTCQPNLPQQSEGKPQHKPEEGFQGMKPKIHTVCSGEITAVNFEDLRLDEGGQKNDGKVVRRKKKGSAKKCVDKATQMDH